ncbi:MAG: Gfo/Idh/MocA family oxidoreductase [Deltaproteobacteria bacterium]|nr:Gfo/Idh/MocA family oxidoreductase [Deltaproteobacteria bacterium]MBW2008276.1 Gfo/Idh/MocA family oxidoreductase [Deltaproteobacteria bacterium]
MKILLIGTGRWGSNHLRVLSGLDVDLYVAEVSAERREKCLEQGIPADHVTSDYRTFAEDVDAVDIVTPASTHFALCEEFLDMGKDVFVEKPITETVPQALALAARADAGDRILQVGHIFRYDPAADYIRSFLGSGKAGEIRSLCGNFSGFKRPRSDGGVTISDALHFIDFFNYIMEKIPDRVLARCEDLLRRGMDDMAWVWMSYNGIPALVEANYFSVNKNRLVTITGDKATLVCDFAASQDKIRVYRNRHILDEDTWKAVGGEVIHQEIPPAEPLLEELKHFVGCVRDRTRPKAVALDGVNSLRVVEAAMRSHNEGKEIFLEPEPATTCSRAPATPGRGLNPRRTRGLPRPDPG